jgi:hypothetical protein
VVQLEGVDLMSSVVSLESTSALCNSCGIPFDSQYFDDSSVVNAPDDVGEEIVLARFDLPPQYCGVLQYFAQFTDRFGRDNSRIDTPEIEWKLLVNNHSFFPYLNLRHIVNPWGFGSYPLNLRLDENSSLELVARRVRLATDQPVVPVLDRVTRVGGRIMGRFWYNPCYGGVEHRNY